MNAQEIIKKLEEGDYKIEYSEVCYCYFHLDVTPSKLEFFVDSSTECGSSNALFVGGALVAEYVRHDGWFVYEDIDVDDIPMPVQQKMILPSFLGRGEIENWKHHLRLKEALVEFLMMGDYEIGRKDGRFANEYTMTLKKVETPIVVTREEAEKWADDYLYEGDSATEAFVGFSMEE